MNAVTRTTPSGAPSTEENETFPGVTALLGPPEHRFFGEGYKRPLHRLTDVRFTDSDSRRPGVNAVAAVEYPGDWSRKSSGNQRPHLSTVDVLLYGVRLAELLLAAEGWGPEVLRDSWLRRARIRAGSSPVEDDLAGFPVTVELEDRVPSPVAGREVTVIRGTVATLRVSLEIDHPAVCGPPSRPVPLPGAPAHPERHLYWDGFRYRGQDIDQLVLEPDRPAANALLRTTTRGPAALPPEGFEAAHQPSAGFVDLFVSALQLGQILLYRLDALTRESSHTLWMRSTSWEADRPDRPAGERLPLLVALEDADILPTREGPLRRAEIKASHHGMRLTCSVVHRLPGA
ncbi:hypothetical protein FNQ90_08880 [Streptomyces alkaliphilus]|uniref:Avirulence D protein (AvrD) n=1 Tax=Streptomyces alkaliphilus TaxID=1472722 RepID=A0A7W3TCX9_9ACTN|nr:AvrD family protein [Streptomyces alkaliphilus]MBB0244215.1 hypothetical protein [Streptomyces alkaliphilus]